MAEGIVAKHFHAYDHFAMNDIPKDVGVKVIAEWRDAADRIGTMTPDQINVALNLKESYSTRLDAEVTHHTPEVAAMLQALADECERFYQQEEWLCILGM